MKNNKLYEICELVKQASLGVEKVAIDQRMDEDYPNSTEAYNYKNFAQYAKDYQDNTENYMQRSYNPLISFGKSLKGGMLGFAGGTGLASLAMLSSPYIKSALDKLYNIESQNTLPGPFSDKKSGKGKFRKRKYGKFGTIVDNLLQTAVVKGKNFLRPRLKKFYNNVTYADNALNDPRIVFSTLWNTANKGGMLGTSLAAFNEGYDASKYLSGGNTIAGIIGGLGSVGAVMNGRPNMGSMGLPTIAYLGELSDKLKNRQMIYDLETQTGKRLRPLLQDSTGDEDLDNKIILSKLKRG